MSLTPLIIGPFLPPKHDSFKPTNFPKHKYDHVLGFLFDRTCAKQRPMLMTDRTIIVGFDSKTTLGTVFIKRGYIYIYIYIYMYMYHSYQNVG